MDPRVEYALDALRDADRLLGIARTTFARELEEARRERGVTRGAINEVADMVDMKVFGRDTTRESDAVLAGQEVDEAIRALHRAQASIPDESPIRERLIAGLGSIRGAFEQRRQALHQLTRWVFEELRTSTPELAATPPLPNWDQTDAEDEALARAAGTDLAGLLRRTWPGILVAAAFITFVLLSRHL